ncbi:MAG: S-layer homology domain-containing protein [Acidimicrobiia bacterium]|nr:S-layer homology domain-containing protein [Acidimicrobiia bacterium]
MNRELQAVFIAAGMNFEDVTDLWDQTEFAGLQPGPFDSVRMHGRHAYLQREEHSAFTAEGETLVSKSRIRRRTVFVSILAVILIVPIAAYGGSVFDDVADTDAHATGIEWMKSVGVTAGCGNNNYCPDRDVTRAEMATFMYRLSSVVDSDGYSVFHDAAVAIPGATILTLANIPAGSYVFIGKTTFNNATASSSSASCKLMAGAQFDQVRATVAPHNWVPASFTVVNTFTTNGNSVTLECVGFSGVTANDTKITAIEVNALANTGG